MPSSTDLRQAFQITFIEAYTSHRWEVSRSRSYWVELEPWQDSIAGPLHSIIESGGCEYVYCRGDSYLAKVDDPESLRQRLLEWHANLAAGVEKFTPASPAEERDLSFMQKLVDDMRVLIDLAMKVEARRWQASRHPTC